jgi:hypothetical protein
LVSYSRASAAKAFFVSACGKWLTAEEILVMPEPELE